MFSVWLAQLGGIGQTLTIGEPSTALDKLFNKYQDVQIKLVVNDFDLSVSGEKTNRYWTVLFCALFPVLYLSVYCFERAPKQLVLSGLPMQAIMLGATASYFRYQSCDARVRPGVHFGMSACGSPGQGLWWREVGPSLTS